MATPSQHNIRQAYATLGLRDGTPVARCVRRYDRLAWRFDPRRWPPDPATQRAAIAVRDALNEALALIIDADRWGIAELEVAA